MNSQTLGELARDRKIDTVFHAFGYSIPVGKDGRRLWPTPFKREVGRRMRAGKLSVDDVQKTCQISDKTAYKWRKGSSRKPSNPEKKFEQPAPVFAEIKVERDEPVTPSQPSRIVFKRAGCELLLPTDYPIDRLVQLISAFESNS